MKYTGTDTLEILEGAKNYNTWIASQITPWLKGPLLEIGSGTGNITSFFLPFQPFFITDKEQSFIVSLKRKFGFEPNVKIEKYDIEKDNISYKKKFASVVSINVLEHIHNDQKAIQNIYTLLDTGGRLVLLVPAKKFAYTKLDKHLGHFRRYEKKELKEKLEKAKFHIEKIEYFNIIGLVSWMVRNMLDKEGRRLQPSHIKIFDAIVPLLRIVESIIPTPIGISLIVIAKKTH